MAVYMTPGYIAATTQPLHHARIGWQNLARGAVITANGTAAGSNLYAPANDQTWEWWQGTLAPIPGFWAATFATPTTINYLAVAAHEGGSAQATFVIDYDAGAGWVEIPGSEFSPADDSPVMVLFENIVCDAIRIRGTGVPPLFFPRVCVIHFGKILEMPRPARWIGHVPGVLNRQFEARPNISERGQRLGNSLIREGLSAAFEFANLDEHWVRATFDLFMRNCMRYGYFIAWRPNQFPDEVLYGWTDQPFPPVNAHGGINRRMSVSWQMKCHNWQGVQAWESES